MSESNEILYLIKTIMNPQILVDDMLKKFYLCISIDYGKIACKTLMKIEDKNSKAYYNLLQNLKAFKYGMKYIEKEYLKSINISNEIDYKFLDGKLIIQYRNIDNIVDFFKKRKYKPIFIEQDIIQDCFDNHYMLCLMYNNLNYLSFYLTNKNTDGQYDIDIVHLNHEIKSIVDSINKENDKSQELIPKTITKIYSTITDAFSNNDCLSELQIISPGYNHATGMHKNEVEDVCINLVYEKFNNVYSIVRIKGYYCKHCKMYFDFEDSFKQQLDFLKINPSQIIAVYCNEKMEHLDGRLLKTSDNLATKSILGRFGYSTSKNSKQRHSIIDFVLENNYASKAELVNLLSWLIRFNGARAYDAKFTWERDIMYINQK